MRAKRPGDTPPSANAEAKTENAREKGFADKTKHGVTSPGVADEPTTDWPPELLAFFQAQAKRIAFEYSEEQWIEIAKSIEHFHAKPDVYEKAFLKLQNSARSFFLETLNAPGLKRQKKWRVNHWTKAGKLAEALMSVFFWLARDEGNNGPPSSRNESKSYHQELLALMKIRLLATAHIVSLGGKADDGYRKLGPEAVALMKAIVTADDVSYPRTTAKSAYHSDVLDVWTELGGKLKFSRHPTKGKIKGPLARYFSAVTYPVHGGSPESLPDIIERHVAQKAALEK
jgi:hypothetical protein